MKDTIYNPTFEAALFMARLIEVPAAAATTATATDLEASRALGAAFSYGYTLGYLQGTARDLEGWQEAYIENVAVARRYRGINA